MSQRYPVFVDGQRYTPEFQTEHQYRKGWQSVLAKAYHAGNDAKLVRCGCPSVLERPLYISLHDGRYRLSRWPGQGSHHTQDCRFYAMDPKLSGMRFYQDGVVRELAGGRLALKMDLTFNGHPTLPHGEPGNTGLPVVGAQGFLHALWHEAGLNIWNPSLEGKRTVGVVGRRLRKAVSRILDGAGDWANRLVVPAVRNSPAHRFNRAAVEYGACGDYRIPIAAVGALARAKDGTVELPELLRFSHPFGYPHIYLQEPERSQLQVLYGPQIEAWLAGEPVVMLAALEIRKAIVTGNTYAVLRGAALMRVSPRWVPVDTDEQAAIEHELALKSVHYERPLAFDAEPGLLPDLPVFWMTQGGERVEVWMQQAQESPD